MMCVLNKVKLGNTAADTEVDTQVLVWNSQPGDSLFFHFSGDCRLLQPLFGRGVLVGRHCEGRQTGLCWAG